MTKAGFRRAPVQPGMRSMLGFVDPLFTSMTHRNEKFWEYEFPGLQVAEYGRGDGIVGYSWVAWYTWEFLDAYLVDAVMSWAYRLMADGHLPEAIDVVKLAVQIDPSSGVQIHSQE